MGILPTHCRHCKTKLAWTDSGTDLWCPNNNCFGVGLERLDRFFEKIKVEGLSRKRLIELSKNGIDSPLKVLKLTENKIAGLEGFGKVLAKKLVDNIKIATKNTSTVELMAASGIFQNEQLGLSTNRLELICDRLNRSDIERGVPEKVKGKILNIKGIGPESIKLFIDKLAEFQVFYNQILTVITITDASLKSTDLAGYTFAFSGFRSSELETVIKQNGGKVSSSGVTQSTTHLFTDSQTSGNVQKALKYKEKGINIKIVSSASAENCILDLMRS